MKRYLYIITLIMTMSFGFSGTMSAAEADDIVFNADGSHKDNAAFIIDAQSINNFCSSRPQRILPTYGSKPNHSQGRLALINHNSCMTYCRWGSVVRLESAPFQSSASRDYYVIALRHIIR